MTLSIFIAVAMYFVFLPEKGYCDASGMNASLPLEEAILRSEGVSLSRRRRYLIFPEGSSLQVVFCLTYPMILKIGDIFLMGATASLAWELPQDPYSPFHHHAEALHRNDEGTYKYVNSKPSSKESNWSKNILINRFTGKPIQPTANAYYSNAAKLNKNSVDRNKKAEYKRRKTIINPAFAKRSIDNLDLRAKVRKRKAAILSIDRGGMHRRREGREHLNSGYMSRDNREYHRYSRCGLYEKLEKLLRGMGFDGKHCILKALCEVGQGQREKQGSFLDEIMRVIFTLPWGDEFLALHHQAYDDAHTHTKNCTELYPKCSSSLKNMPLR